MPGIVRLSTKELDELIEETEAAGNDTTELRGLLAEVEKRRWQPARPPRGVELRAEMTTEERLSAEAGYLFLGGFSADILRMCIEYDAKYSLRELRTMCVEAGLSPSGHKKLLAAKLIAHQWEAEGKEKAEKPGLFTF